MKVVKARTSRTGSYATVVRAPAPGSYVFRTLAPRARVAGRVRAQYTTSARALSVVAQRAALSIATTAVTDEAVTATLTFRPVRAGRAVTLQVWRSGAWTAAATGRQSTDGTANLPVPTGSAGPSTYRGFDRRRGRGAGLRQPSAHPERDRRT